MDLTDEGSIDMAGTWKQDVLNNSFYTEQSEYGEKIRKKSMKSQMQVPILLLGNKLDQVCINSLSYSRLHLAIIDRQMASHKQFFANVEKFELRLILNFFMFKSLFFCVLKKGLERTNKN